jgi:hypothetical protein
LGISRIRIVSINVAASFAAVAVAATVIIITIVIIVVVVVILSGGILVRATAILVIVTVIIVVVAGVVVEEIIFRLAREGRIIPSEGCTIKLLPRLNIGVAVCGILPVERPMAHGGLGAKRRKD